MKYLVLDFETKDPYIKRGVGAGWVYMMNTPNHDFKVLGCALKGSAYLEGKYIVNTSTDSGYINFQNNVHSAIQTADVLIAHNAPYDFGILLAMGISLKDKMLFDTKIMSILHYNALKSHSLDELGKVYFKERKEKKQLADAVWDNNLYPWSKKELKEKEKFEKPTEVDIKLGHGDGSAVSSGHWEETKVYRRTRPLEVKLQKFAIENMDLLQDKYLDIVASYAIQDVVLTEKLFNFFYEKQENKEIYNTFSDLIKCCLKMRMDGVQIDLKAARQTHKDLIPKISQALSKCYELAGKEFNIRSPKDVPAILKSRGLTLPKTEKGGDSVTTSFLESSDDELCAALMEARKLIKIDSDFIQHLQEIQQWTLGITPAEVDTKDIGIVYPEMNILGATATGRFSSSSPNLQQIPSRDPVYGPLCRNLFIAPEGKQWHSLDFSNQEGRIQIHYASLLGCMGTEELVQAFKLNPDIDMHLKVAQLIWGKHITKDDIERKYAKTVNLGLSYGMGNKKLATSLSLSEVESKELLHKYHSQVPFLLELINKCQNAMKEKGYITTLMGRKIWDEPSYWDADRRKELTFEYKALNKLIQGSAADQTILAMVECYRKGIPISVAVHDEINLIGTIGQAEQVRDIMETCIKSVIPHRADIQSGKSWGAAKFGGNK